MGKRTFASRTLGKAWTFQVATLAGVASATATDVITKRFSLIGTSRQRLSLTGVSAERFGLVGTSQERLTLNGSSE